MLTACSGQRTAPNGATPVEVGEVTSCVEIAQARTNNDPALPILYRRAIQQGLGCPEMEGWEQAMTAPLVPGGDWLGPARPPKTAAQRQRVKLVPDHLRAACLSLVRGMAMGDVPEMRAALVQMREPLPDEFIANSRTQALMARYRPFAEPVEVPVGIKGEALFPGGRLVGKRSMTLRCALGVSADKWRFHGLVVEVEEGGR